MTDTTLTKDHRIKAFNWLYGLAGDEGHESVSILEEYVSGLEECIETLTSLEATVENLRGEVDTLQRQLSEARDVNERLTFARREQALADLARISQELGLYDIEE